MVMVEVLTLVAADSEGVAVVSNRSSLGEVKNSHDSEEIAHIHTVLAVEGTVVIEGSSSQVLDVEQDSRCYVSSLALQMQAVNRD